MDTVKKHCLHCNQEFEGICDGLMICDECIEEANPRLKHLLRMRPAKFYKEMFGLGMTIKYVIDGAPIWSTKS
jgi:hypothetical protein